MLSSHTESQARESKFLVSIVNVHSCGRLFTIASLCLFSYLRNHLGDFRAVA